MKQGRNFHTTIGLGLAVATLASLAVWAIAFKGAFILLGVDFIH